MEYLIQGMKTRDIEINKRYDDVRVAKFEFECFQLNNISQYLALYEVDNGIMQQIDLYINN